jgi:hypothetical protein
MSADSALRQTMRSGNIFSSTFSGGYSFFPDLAPQTNEMYGVGRPRSAWHRLGSAAPLLEFLKSKTT